MSPGADIAVTVTRSCVGVWCLRRGKLLAKLADSPLGAIVTHAEVTADGRRVKIIKNINTDFSSFYLAVLFLFTILFIILFLLLFLFLFLLLFFLFTYHLCSRSFYLLFLFYIYYYYFISSFLFSIYSIIPHSEGTFLCIRFMSSYPFSNFDSSIPDSKKIFSMHI